MKEAVDDEKAGEAEAEEEEALLDVEAVDAKGGAERCADWPDGCAGGT